MPATPDAEALAWLDEATSELAARAPVRRAQMFGMPTIRIDGGKSLAGVYGPDLVVKLDPEARARALAVPGAHPFEPMPGRQMGAWVVLPGAARETWAGFLEDALDAVER